MYFDISKDNPIGTIIPIVETNEFILSKTNRPYDFVAVLENKTDHALVFDFNDNYDQIVVPPGDWIGFCNNETDPLCAIIEREFVLTREECSNV